MRPRKRIARIRCHMSEKRKSSINKKKMSKDAKNKHLDEKMFKN